MPDSVPDSRTSFDALSFLPLAVTCIVVVAALLGMHALLLRRKGLSTEDRLPRQVVMLVLTAAGIIAILVVMPVRDATQGQLIGLFGVILAAILGLSSTTFVANAMAGVMLRSVRSFRPGDFIRVGDHLGRVTERGLFHVEIQTEDRDLTTLPNMYLVQNPIRVVRSSGTIVSASLSLGYDVSHVTLEPLFLEAAKAAGLEDPFAQVLDLGDFAVTYRVAGFLPEVKHLLTARSVLRKRILDTLHGAGVEIVSPSFMNQRRLDTGRPVIPVDAASPQEAVTDDVAPEDRIFDKAEEVGRLEALRSERAALEAEIGERRKSLGSLEDAERPEAERGLEREQGRLDAIDAEIDEVEKAVEAQNDGA